MRTPPRRRAPWGPWRGARRTSSERAGARGAGTWAGDRTGEQAVIPELPPLLSRVHLVGVGGAGMSGIARILLARGAPVSGSDAKDSRAARSPCARWAREVAVGHDAVQPRAPGDPRRRLHRPHPADGQPRAARGRARAGSRCCRARPCSPRSWPATRRLRRRHARQDHDDVDADRRAAGAAAPTRRSRSAATSTSPGRAPTTATGDVSSPRPTRATARSCCSRPPWRS